VCVVGLQRRTGEIDSVRTDEGGTSLFEVRLTNLKTAVKGAKTAAITNISTRNAPMIADGLRLRR